MRTVSLFGRIQYIYLNLFNSLNVERAYPASGVHTLPVTDNCSAQISSRERMALGQSQEKYVAYCRANQA